MYQVYARNKKSNIVILEGDRYSFRCRQRNPNVKSFKFISFKEMEKCNKFGTNVYGPFFYKTVGKL